MFHRAHRFFTLRPTAPLPSAPQALPQALPKRFSWLRGRLPRRKLRSDDVLAFTSWFLLGNGVLAAFQTTTFLSCWWSVVRLLGLEPTVIASLEHAISKDSGLRVSLGDRVDLCWTDGRIALRNVRLQRHTELLPAAQQVPNWTHADVEVDEIRISLDAMRWLRGNGWIRDVFLQGVRGTIDRRHLDFSQVDAETWLERRKPTENDWEWRQTNIEDLQLTVLDYGGFRPYNFAIHHASLPKLRVQWLLFDILSADRMLGEYDGSLFSLTRIPPTIGGNLADLPFPAPKDRHSFARLRKVRMSGLNIDMLNYGATGPITWIDRGTVDFDVVLVLPPPAVHSATENSADPARDPFEGDDEERMLAKFSSELDEIKDKLLEDLRQKWMQDVLHRDRRQEETAEEVEATSEESSPSSPPDTDRLRFYVDARLHNIRATIPDQVSAESPLPAPLIRPVIAYLNAQPTAPKAQKSSSPPISCYFSLPITQLNGALTLYQAHILDTLGESLANALARMVVIRYVEYQQRGRKKRIDAQQAESSWTRWLPWLDADQDESDAAPFESAQEEESQEEVKLEKSFDELLQESPAGMEARGASIVSRVAWWAVQQAGKGMVAVEDGRPSTLDQEEERFLEVYNEMIWGL